MSHRRYLQILLLFLAFASALTLRSAFNYQAVLGSETVWFQDADAVFHARTIQNLVHNFPFRSGLDPYSRFPRGQDVDTGPFHDYLIATVAWVAGLGAPSPRLTDVVAAWMPAILGALIVIPVYFLGRALFHPLVGAIACVLTAILPGAFLWVTRLGNPDHHVSEALLSTVLLLLLVKSLQENGPRRLVMLSGVVLGCYLATRAAGAFLVVFIAIWALLQIAMNHLRGQDSRLVWRVTVPPLCLGWFIFFLTGPSVWSNITALALFGAIASISAAVALAEAVRSRGLFVVVCAAVLAAEGGGIALLKPELAASALASVTDRATGTAQTVGELRPLLTATGTFSLAPAWAEFSTCWFLALPALVYVGWRAVRTNSPAHLLFAVWSALMLAAAFLQIRNCYYLAINVALLTAFASEQLLRLQRRYEQLVAALLVAVALLGPNALLAYSLASADTGPREDWRTTLAFLRKSTPEPFGDPAAFDRYFPRQAAGAAYPYPTSAYGILSWWDFGHWITGYGRRIPVANGMQSGAVEAARFFTSTNPEEAAEILRKNRARYVIADSSMPIGGPQALQPSNGNFLAMAQWAKKDLSQYWEEYLGGSPGSNAVEFQVFYPAYYKTMLARLYLFDGQPQTAIASTWVIRYTEERKDGRTRKRLRDSKQFRSYPEAEQYLKANPEPNLIIAGLHPLKSCVPLPQLEGYDLVSTTQEPPIPPGRVLHAVKVFETKFR